MQIRTYIDRPTMGRAAARHAVRVMQDAIAARGQARVIAATGASQFDFLEALTHIHPAVVVVVWVPVIVWFAADAWLARGSTGMTPGLLAAAFDPESLAAGERYLARTFGRKRGKSDWGR